MGSLTCAVAILLALTCLLSSANKPTTPKNFFKENCECPTMWSCKCCPRIIPNVPAIFSPNVCGTFSLQQDNLHFKVIVTLNKINVFSMEIDPRKMTPVCFNFNVKSINVNPCLDFYALVMHKDFDNPKNTEKYVHICVNASMTVQPLGFIHFHLFCMDANPHHIKKVSPDHNGNLIMTSHTEPASGKPKSRTQQSIHELAKKMRSG